MQEARGNSNSSSSLRSTSSQTRSMLSANNKLSELNGNGD